LQKSEIRFGNKFSNELEQGIRKCNFKFLDWPVLGKALPVGLSLKSMANRDWKILLVDYISIIIIHNNYRKFSQSTFRCGC
jgi:hypothetical protein